jgi:asparagine synthase (glutamine-hydrolysing)
MCGICGVYNVQSGAPVLRETIERMVHPISHRGPDDSGVYLSDNAGLGFARLSIIDLSGGHQPMSNEVGSIWLVFNGEIWNYQALRQILLEKGHRFGTSSDSETVVHA